ncbi:MAG: hypothetical protein CL908_25750 [Deltaproteobacteria bacterium]|nr:hypothetical protein [Deltaproteobacteria bacterium]
MIVFVPRRALIPVVLATIASAPLWRAASIELGYNAIATNIFTISCFDSLGMGALLAIARDPLHGSEALLAALRRTALFVGGPLLLLTWGLHVEDSWPAFQLIVRDLAMALAFTWIVDRACDGLGGWFGSLLGWGPVRYVGKISYGIYLYHRFIRGLLFIMVTEGQLPPPSNPMTRFLRIALVSLVVAALSWHWLEAPINRLKERFPYDRASS